MQGHVYHWRHGWIPLTHYAALVKAKGSHKLAAKYLDGSKGHHGSESHKIGGALKVDEHIHARQSGVSHVVSDWTKKADGVYEHPSGHSVHFAPNGSLTDEERRTYVEKIDKAVAATSQTVQHPVKFVVPADNSSFRRRSGGEASGYVFQGSHDTVFLNPSLLTDQAQRNHDYAQTINHHMRAGESVHPITYAATHEMGHTHDFKNGHTFNGALYKPDAAGFFRSQKQNLSTYGGSRTVEGYAEAFAQHHLRPASQRGTAATLLASMKRVGIKPTAGHEALHNMAADKYAEKYGWR